jgi:hypothetical protein
VQGGAVVVATRVDVYAALVDQERDHGVVAGVYRVVKDADLIQAHAPFPQRPRLVRRAVGGRLVQRRPAPGDSVGGEIGPFLAQQFRLPAVELVAAQPPQGCRVALHLVQVLDAQGFAAQGVVVLQVQKPQARQTICR